MSTVVRTQTETDQPADGGGAVPPTRPTELNTTRVNTLLTHPFDTTLRIQQHLDAALNRGRGRDEDSSDDDESGGPGDPDDDDDDDDDGDDTRGGAQGRTRKCDLKIMGNLPATFTGDRSKAEQFIDEIKNYMRLNKGVPGFNSPKRKVALALTVIQGPEVEGWTRKIGKWLDSLGRPEDDHEEVWRQFLKEFKNNFHDSSRDQRARMEIEKLTMRYPLIDQYISKFEDLARLANYNLRSGEIFNLFLKGLPTNVLQQTMTFPTPPNYNLLKEKAIEVTKSLQLIDAIKGNQNRLPITTNQGYRPPFQRNFNNFGRTNQGQYNNQRPQGYNPNYRRFNSSNAPRYMNNQPVPMDLDRSRAPQQRNWRNNARNYTTQMDTRRPTTRGACFNCGKQGHFARECPNKSGQVNATNWDEDLLQEMDQHPTMIPDTHARTTQATQLLNSMSREETDALIQTLTPSQDFPSA
jgi:hypothetical protein